MSGAAAAAAGGVGGGGGGGGPLVKINSRGASEPEKHGGPGPGRQRRSVPLTDTHRQAHPAPLAPASPQLPGKFPVNVSTPRPHYSFNPTPKINHTVSQWGLV